MNAPVICGFGAAPLPDDFQAAMREIGMRTPLPGDYELLTDVPDTEMARTNQQLPL